MDENLVTPYVQQFNLGVQYEFARNFVLEANYITTQGRKLTGIININTFNGRTGRVFDPFLVRNNGSTRRPNPRIAGDQFRTNAFKSIYHGGQIRVRNRPWHGLQFNTHYTFAKAIDEISDAFGARGGTNPMDNFNIKVDRGRADFDIRHRFVAGVSYEVPFMNGNRWLGGWVLSGSSSYSRAYPFPCSISVRTPTETGSSLTGLYLLAPAT